MRKASSAVGAVTVNYAKDGEDMNKSESIKEVAVALVKFNGEVSKISKDAANPFFKNNYATLDNIIDEIRPVLQKHGLSILQIPGGDGENVVMKTLLLHESGEWIESDPLIMKPIKNDPQSVGSCVTYARRYSLASFLSLNTGEDDDGNGATNIESPKQPKSQPSKTETPKNPTGNATVRVYKLREDMGWGWSDLNQFAAGVLDRDIKYLKKDIKDEEEWKRIEEAMLHTKAQLVNS